MNEGFLDTNVVIHAHKPEDVSNAECVAFLEALERGDVRARVDVAVLHELTYAFPRVIKQFTRTTLAGYLISILSWPGIVCDKDLLIESMERWGSTPGLSFVDAYLAANAVRYGLPVFTKNVRELAAQGIEVPVPLSS